MYISVSSGGNILSSIDTKNWSFQNLKLPINDIFFKNDALVAVSQNGKILISNDSINWELIDPGINCWLKSIVYGNDLWVAVGWDGVILTSKDLINWQKQKSNTSILLTSITFGNDLFIATGYNGKILISNDGINWNILNLSSDLSFEGIVYINNKFVALGKNGKILVSENGINWFPKNSNTTYSLNSCAFGKDQNNKDIYIIVGKNGKILLSYDLDTFENIDLNFKHDIFKVIYENNLFLASSSKGNILISKDGRKWEIIQTNINDDLVSIVFAKFEKNPFLKKDSETKVDLSNTFVGVKTEKKKKFNLDKWVLSKTPTKNDLFDIVFYKDIFIIAGKNGDIILSYPLTNLENENITKLISWELINLNINNHLRSIAFNENNIVIVGDNGVILKNNISDTPNLFDPLKWEKYSINNLFLNSITFGNDLWIAVGMNGKILISEDLNNWETITHDFIAHFTSVIPFQDYFIISGLMGVILILEKDIGLHKSYTNIDNHIYSLAYK